MDSNNVTYEYTEAEYEENAIEDKNAMVIVSLICGILSVLCCPTYCLPLICGVLAIVFSIIGKKKTSSKKALGTIGMILGIAGILIGTIASIVVTLVWILPMLDL